MAARESLAPPHGPQKTLRERADEARRAGGPAGAAAVSTDPGAIVCDQAVFTSVRTPMGEGYRIIAASPGLKPEERQAITRNAPSHDALCDPGEGATCVAFYTLPSGRLCVAHSCCAGAEHTGRGGQRIYTINVVFDAGQFARAGFNPFQVLRSMAAAGLTKPQLKPPSELPPVTLRMDEAGDPDTCPSLFAIRHSPFDLESKLPSPLRRYVVHELLGETKLCVCIADDLQATAEALLLALPGPMRAKISLAAGLKFSVSRSYRLSVVTEDTGATEARISGQPIRYLKRGAAPPSPAPDNDWMKMVEGCLSTGRVGELAQRTSRAFHDCTPQGRQRIARLFLAVDEVGTAKTARLLAIAGEYLGAKATACEKELLDDLLARTQRRLGECLAVTDVAAVRAYWAAVVDLWRRSPEAAVFMHGAVSAILRTAATKAPAEAADMALAVARNIPEAAASLGHNAVLDQVLEAFAARAQSVVDEQQRETMRAIAHKWNAIRPGQPALTRILEKLAPGTNPPAPAAA